MSKYDGLLCYPLPNVLRQHTKHCWWKWPLIALIMKRQKQILTSIVMCKSCLDLLPYFPYCSLFTISSSSTRWRMSSSMIYGSVSKGNIFLVHKLEHQIQIWCIWSLQSIGGCKAWIHHHEMGYIFRAPSF